MRTLMSLPDDERRRIMDALLLTALGEELPELTAMENAVFELIKAQVDRANALSSKRKQTGEGGGAPAGNDNAANKQPKTTKNNQTPQPNKQKQPNAAMEQPKTTTNTITITSTDTITSTSTDTSTDTSTVTDTRENTPPFPPDGTTNDPSLTGATNGLPLVAVTNDAPLDADDPGLTASPPGKPHKKPPKILYAEFVSMTNDEHSSLVAKVGEQGAARCIEILDNYKGSSGKKYKSDYRTILNWVVERYEDEQSRASPKGGAWSGARDARDGQGGGREPIPVEQLIYSKVL
jgi:hypothetical protein